MRAVRWAIAVAALAVAVPARADDTVRRDAEARVEEGLARVRAHDLEGALQSFRQAVALMRKPEIMWNLALIEEKTNHPVDALAHIKEYLRLAPGTDPDRPRAQKHVDALNAAAGHISVAAPTGAAITLDGTQPLGAAPLAEIVDVSPGHHDVEARLGTLVKTVPVEALAGQTIQADFRGMDASTATAPGATAPQADRGPPAGEPPPPDTAQSGPRFFTPRMVTAVSLGGAAIVSLGTGVGFALAASSNASTAAGYAKENPNACANSVSTPACTQWKGAVNGQNTDTTLSYVFYATSGLLAAGSIVTLLLWPSEPKNVSAWIVPTASPAGFGLGAAGRF